MRILLIFLMMPIFIARAESLPKVLLFLGDSLTAGYGVTKSESYPARLQEKIHSANLDWVVVNGAESGSLTSSLEERLKFYLNREPRPRVVVIASGGNDARQKSSTKNIEAQLKSCVRMAKKAKLKVVVIGMKIFPNLGKEYAEQFAAIYPRLTKKEKVMLIPFLLDGVAGQPDMNQADGFHPNSKGHEKIAETLWPYFQEILK